MEKDFTLCKKILAECKMVEIRGDLCNFSSNQIQELVQLHSNLIFTYRLANNSLEIAKEQICTAIKSGAKYVDIEIEAPIDFLEQIKSYARVNGCKLIISYHNYNSTNKLEELQLIYDISRRKGADIVKITTQANNLEDASTVMQLYKYKKEDKDLHPDNFLERGELTSSLTNSFGSEQAKLVAFCMGGVGKFTRELCLHLGSPFTYAAYNKSQKTAEGQYTLLEMEEILNKKNYPHPLPKLNNTIFKNNNTPKINIPCSKSIAQRAILAAALSNGESILENFSLCKDTKGALEVIKILGATYVIKNNNLHIKGITEFTNPKEINVLESGLLARLISPICTIFSKGNDVKIIGEGSILNRDMYQTINALNLSGLKCTSKNGKLPFVIGGEIENFNIEFSGNESSQIVSGFLFALPLLKNDSKLTVTDPTSLPYINLTISILQKFGIKINTQEILNENGLEKIIFNIKGNQKYIPNTIYLDADWSSAAYFAVAGALSNGVTLLNMPLNHLQADEYILTVLKDYGCEINTKQTEKFNQISIGKINKSLRNTIEHSFYNTPDIFPISTTLAMYSNCTTKLNGIKRLLKKESNRAESIFNEFTKLGCKHLYKRRYNVYFSKKQHKKLIHK
jgi:5-enolpyruvylshikimate-3-phosphate synthase